MCLEKAEDKIIYETWATFKEFQTKNKSPYTNVYDFFYDFFYDFIKSFLSISALESEILNPMPSINSDSGRENYFGSGRIRISNRAL